MVSELQLQKKIQELEELLKQKDFEIGRYRAELSKANHVLEAMIADISQDLKIATAIQKILSPTELPNINGVEMSTKFIAGSGSGGDYFDIFEHEDRLKFGVVLASSSGYAISALFLSILIQMSSKIEARKGLSPELVLLEMAKEMIPQIHEKDQAHIFYGVLDRRNFELTFSSCGPIAAYHEQHETGTWARLEPTAPALTKTFTQSPLKHSLVMGPKDRLVLCTQGILQSKNLQGQEFGHENLLATLQKLSDVTVHDVRNEVLFQVQKFSGQTEPFRDQTVLVMEVKDRVIKLAKK